MSLAEQISSFLDATSWSRVLCRDLQQLLVTWLHNDVHYLAICSICPDDVVWCSVHRTVLMHCALLHYPARAELAWAAALHAPAAVLNSPFRTYEMLLLAIATRPCILTWLWHNREITQEMCAFAVALNADNLFYVPYACQTDELRAATMQRDGLCLRHISYDRRTKLMCDMAYANNPLAWQYIPDDLCSNYPDPFK